MKYYGRLLIPILAGSGLLATSVQAGLTNRAGRDELDRRVREVQLDSGVWSATPTAVRPITIDPLPTASSFGGKSLIRAQSTRNTWLQVASTSETRRASQRMETTLYSPGIRSTLVSWSRLLAEVSPNDSLDDVIDAVGNDQVIEQPMEDFIPPEGPTVDDPMDNLPMPDIGSGTVGIPSPSGAMLGIVGLVCLMHRRRNL